MQEYLGLLIAAARRRIKQAVLARVGEHRLTAQQFWLLVAIAEHPGLSQTQLAERVRSDAPAVSRALSPLLGRRLVRNDVHAADRRRSRISLTAAGERLARQLAPVAHEIRAAVVGEMTEQEVTTLGEGLRRVLANLEALDTRGRGRRGAADPRRAVAP